MRGKDAVNLDFDPPPDLTIEIDAQHSSLNRMSIFAAIGIPEVWRYDGEFLTIYLLKDGVYVQSNTSSVLPKVRTQRLLELIETGIYRTRKEFLSKIKEYSSELKSTE